MTETIVAPKTTVKKAKAVAQREKLYTVDEYKTPTYSIY